MKYCIWLTRLIEKLCFVGMLLMVGILFAEVIFRYMFNSSIYWSNDAAIYLMVANTFFAACVGVSGRNLTRIDFFVEKLPKTMHRVVEVVDNLLCSLCCGLLCVAAIPLIQSGTGVRMATLPFSSSMPYWIVCISSAIMATYYIILATEDMIRRDAS
jgi:TRAP-type C4-dicarboxylate transport system permease small subunit